MLNQFQTGQGQHAAQNGELTYQTNAHVVGHIQGQHWPSILLLPNSLPLKMAANSLR